MSLYTAASTLACLIVDKVFPDRGAIRVELDRMTVNLLREEIEKAIRGDENEFALRIRLGNAQMRSRHSVAFALQQVALQLRTPMRSKPNARITEHVQEDAILDINGNVVGGWRFHRKD
jgi:hypothetical protein